MTQSRVVRGYGPLDLYIAKLRHRQALKRIKLPGRNERILDIGCGCYPLFLSDAAFAEKYGLDKVIEADYEGKMEQQGITLLSYDIEKEQELPFLGDFFDVVTMLAVFEHIQPSKLIYILKEIKRVLRGNGRFILTTPAPWSAPLLWFLAKIRVISSEEIYDHKRTYDRRAIVNHLAKAGFESEKISSGYFEFFLNIWVCADK